MIKIDKPGVSVRISSAVISTFMGHNGRGMIPYRLLPDHKYLLEVIKANRVNVFSKSWTREARIGNFRLGNPFSWRYVQWLAPRSMVNAFGLTNDGVLENWADCQKSISMGIKVAPNLYPELDKGKGIATQGLLEMLEICSSADLIEINVACVNSREIVGSNDEAIIHCLRAVRKSQPFKVIVVKMNVEHGDGLYRTIQSEQLADVLHCFNSARYQHLFPGETSPLPNGAGGVSGALAKEIGKKRFKEVRKLTTLPMIAGLGIESTRDIEACFGEGANSVSFCTKLAYTLREGACLIKDVCAGDS